MKNKDISSLQDIVNNLKETVKSDSFFLAKIAELEDERDEALECATKWNEKHSTQMERGEAVEKELAMKNHMLDVLGRTPPAITMEKLKRCEQAAEALRDSILKLKTEVNCRIEHGAESGGHLEYIQNKLEELLSHPQPAKREGEG